MKFSARLSTVFVYGVTALAILLLPPIAPGAMAAESNKIRIGDDYRIFNLAKGASFGQCARACEGDAKCKSWTFIRERIIKKKKGLQFNIGDGFNISLGGRDKIIPAQCRLKHSVAPAYDNQCCVSGIIKVTQKPRTRREINCSRYAQNAARQADENLAKQCSYRGRLWHGDVGRYFDRCMRVRPALRRQERIARRDALEQCAANKSRRNAACDLFASTAVKLNDSNRANNCGLRGREWNSNYDRQYSWCLNNPRQRRNILETQRRDLSQCLRRGGGVFNRRCADYATRALQLVDKADRNNCNVTGVRWSPSFKVQYQFCMKSSRRAQRREALGRDNQMARCERRRSGKGRQCDLYARDAVDQIKTARTNQCGLRGAIWHGDYERYFDFCMDNRREVRLARQARRKKEVNQCIARGGPLDPVCDSYANTAVAQSKENIELSCGFSGARWQNNYIRHYRWCKDARRWQRRRETNARTTAINRCVARTKREAKREICNGYADKAARQARRARNNECGYGGQRWRRDRDDHFDWCMDAGEAERTDEERARTRELRQCVGTGDNASIGCQNYARPPSNRSAQHCRDRVGGP